MSEVFEDTFTHHSALRFVEVESLLSVYDEDFIILSKIM